MSDEWQCAVLRNPRSRSRALQRWKCFHFQMLFPLPFTMGAGNWTLILKLMHNISISLGRICYICPSFCDTWLWTWQKRQLRRVDCQSHTGLIYLMLRSPEVFRPSPTASCSWLITFYIPCALQMLSYLQRSWRSHDTSITNTRNARVRKRSTRNQSEHL